MKSAAREPVSSTAIGTARTAHSARPPLNPHHTQDLCMAQGLGEWKRSRNPVMGFSCERDFRLRAPPWDGRGGGKGGWVGIFQNKALAELIYLRALTRRAVFSVRNAPGARGACTALSLSGCPAPWEPAMARAAEVAALRPTSTPSRFAVAPPDPQAQVPNDRQDTLILVQESVIFP